MCRVRWKVLSITGCRSAWWSFLPKVSSSEPFLGCSHINTSFAQRLLGFAGTVASDVPDEDPQLLNGRLEVRGWLCLFSRRLFVPCILFLFPRLECLILLTSLGYRQIMIDAYAFGSFRAGVVALNRGIILGVSLLTASIQDYLIYYSWLKQRNQPLD